MLVDRRDRRDRRGSEELTRGGGGSAVTVVGGARGLGRAMVATR